MSSPNKACLKAVRVQIEQSLEHLRIACTLLRNNNWPENADDLMRSVKHVQVWTQPDGWLDHLERDPIPVENSDV